MSFWQRIFGGFEPAPDFSPVTDSVIVRAIQLRLNAHGADLDVDGVWGDRTDEAISAFKAKNRWLDNPTIGRLTLAALFDEPAIVKESLTAGEPRWMAIARSYLGEREIPGSKHNPRIVGLWKKIGATWFNDDETPYCAAGVGGVLVDAGIPILPPSLAPRARAWEQWGRGLPGPAVGCVVVFERPPSPTNGHVGFVAGKDERGQLMVLGFNQRNAVTIDPFDLKRVTAYRWPVGEPLPAHGMSTLPVVDSRGASSSVNEA